MDAREKTQTQNNTISSGNTELDGKMGGGLPMGSLTLIEGTSGSGKSVLSQQLIWGALQNGYRVALFTTENTVKSLVKQMRSIDLEILDFLLLGRFRAYPVELARLGSQAPAALLEAMKQERDKQLIVVDSFTSAMTHATPHDSLNFFEECKRISGSEITIMLVLHASAVDSDIMPTVRSMCDVHLLLRTQLDGQQLVKTLQIAKVRGSAGATGGIVGFEVEPGWGMRVIPINKARA